MTERELSDFYNSHPEVLAAVEQEQLEEMTDKELAELDAMADERKYNEKYDK